MKYEIKNRWSGEAVYSDEAVSFGALILAAIKAGADLRSADLSGADLYGADLSGAILSGADLRSANLSYANLSYANLSNANLSNANLSNANLSNANLYGAKNIPALASAQSLIVPESGAFEGWKKCKDGVLVHVQIPAKAVRSNATGRKCRAEKAKVLEVIGAKEGISQHDQKTVYKKGKIVKCDKWNEDRWVECGGGIHFFLTRVEAENY